MRKIVDPLPLVRFLHAGRTQDAISIAQRLARGVRLPVPFALLDSAGSIDPMRLAASLLFPIAPMAQSLLVKRAYPDPKEDSHAA